MSSYIPRLTNPGGSKYYTDLNPYYMTVVSGTVPANYGMPNCTAYAYGRWNELAKVSDYSVRYPVGDGGDWVTDGIALGFKSGQEPHLGAAVSWAYQPAGHVAVVEKINGDGSIVTSNSAYYRDYYGGYVDAFPYFYLETFSSLDMLKNHFSNFIGFLYHPNEKDWTGSGGKGFPRIGGLSSNESMAIMTKKKRKGGLCKR